METIDRTYNVYFDLALDAVVMEWRGYATSAQFREGTELMLDTLIRHNANKVLANVKDMVLIGLDDQHWLERDFIPRALAGGFRAIAMVRPAHYFNKVAVESVSYKVDQDKLKIRFFDSEEEAQRWLKG
jgi:hypothetical protein